MKRIIIYAVILAASLMAPIKGTDVGELKPVEAVQLYKMGQTVVIATDTGDSGRGTTVEAAFENLEETTSGNIFLDTADYLLLSAGAMKEAEELRGYLKKSTRVCIAEMNIDTAEAAEYLKVHRPETVLRDLKNLQIAEVLTMDNGRLIMKQRNNLKMIENSS